MNDLVYFIFKRVIGISVIILTIMFIIGKNTKPLILGYIFGMLISMLGFLLLKNSVEKSVKLDPSTAENFARGQYFLRMMIYGLVLVIGAKANYLNFFTVFFGLLIVKIVIMIYTIFDKNFLNQ